MTCVDTSPISLFIYNKPYRGESVNGIANGNGKLLDDNNNTVVYDGEFKYNRFHGKGKEYYTNGRIRFDGLWVDGQMDSGIMYDFNENIIFNGKFKDFAYDKGIEYYNNNEKKKYEGSYKNGKWNDTNGKLYDMNNNKYYEGNITDGVVLGYGISYHPNGKKCYEGNWLNNKYNNFGIEYDINGNMIYYGNWVNGFKQEFGILFNNNKPIYKGYFFKNKRHGKGRLEGDLEETDWINDKQILHHEKYKQEPPIDFICPISQSIMNNPVSTENGNCYDEYEIEKWLSEKNTDPSTNEILKTKNLVPNRYLKNKIDEWKVNNKI